MLLANITVAGKIAQHYPSFAMLRRHPAPARTNFDALLASCAAVDVTLDVDTSFGLARSLDHAQLPGTPYFNTLLRILTTRCMSQACYFSSGEVSVKERHHYGLAVPIYTHFTSPIRRYADVVVHRLLAAAIGVDPLVDAYGDRERMRALCDNINERHTMAQYAGRASVEL